MRHVVRCALWSAHSVLFHHRKVTNDPSIKWSLETCQTLHRTFFSGSSEKRHSSKGGILFGTTAVTDYAKYGPPYGRDIFKTIIDFCNEKACRFVLAVDVGCGSGRSTVPLAAHFDKVIGVDINPKRIAEAPTDVPNVSFRVGPGEDLSFLEDGSVDLVTAAHSMHRMDVDALYPEVQRVLIPGGSFVSYGYGLVRSDEEVVQKVFDHFYNEILGSFWFGGREEILELYRGFNLPFPGWRRDDSLQAERTWSVDHVIGYLLTSPEWQKYLARNPESNAMEDIRKMLRQVYRSGEPTDAERLVKVRWPVYMLMGHKPLN
ncbi:hypothetical protein BaRGS_00033096 [Batillaria attramentaria]|uniref:Methyltransferase type 11 domain-containing protein n=1 Tax=Batillaria attramentaria TaxID=370345 RepID=A0ABD0JL11_9CAEN